LQASCGFCGAITLALATAALQRALSDNINADRVQAALLDFRNALATTRTALRASLEESGA